MSDGTPGSLSEAFERLSQRQEQLEESHQELASRQDETDVSVVKVLDEVVELKRWVRQWMEAQGFTPR